MSPQPSPLRFQDSPDQRAPSDRTVGQDLDNIFRLTAAQPVPGHRQTPSHDRPRAAPAEPRRVTQEDLDAALEMLTRAAKAMDLMQSRYQHVEDYAKGVADRAEKDIAAAYAQARDWEERATGSENQLDAFRSRVVEAERRAESAERNAKEARDWLESFYYKIVESFDTRSLLKSQAA